ncbi:hypothetical protein PU634_11890 [Oceanimonas pelagia]|uniref:Uncharacterized protein n=1 Tax=Oceanimonas pelagia TaxID=3028314 RepID=A0AA50KLT1_9GAMM|nr:hypothetical protein [Oceanimonas pelagia]WMC09814.1 hypothetical protein PU634_11890 [Oceanimonas pelagia]
MTLGWEDKNNKEHDINKLLTAAAALLAFTLASPVLAVSQAGLNVVDNKVAGVYRSEHKQVA